MAITTAYEGYITIAALNTEYLLTADPDTNDGVYHIMISAGYSSDSKFLIRVYSNGAIIYKCWMRSPYRSQVLPPLQLQDNWKVTIAQLAGPLGDIERSIRKVG
jgi:hypothetical protein